MTRDMDLLSFERERERRRVREDIYGILTYNEDETRKCKVLEVARVKA